MDPDIDGAAKKSAFAHGKSLIRDPNCRQG
jgi:hypothetical protein